MQLAGLQLTNTSALIGNDVATFPDFPAEIRAPRGTKAGVSGFQIHFANHEIFTPGDQVDALVAMNPAALVTNLVDLKRGGILIVNKDAFEAKGLQQAGYERPFGRRQLAKLSRVSSGDDEAYENLRRRIGTKSERSRSLQKLLRNGFGVLAVRSPIGANATLH